MSNGILRKTSVSIAREVQYGVEHSNPYIFSLGVVEFGWKETIEKAENNAMLGSTYEVDSVKETLRRMEWTMKLKVNENILPLLLLQKFSIVTSLVGGETAVFSHKLTYLNSNSATLGQSFALYFDDPDREDLVALGARYEKIDLVAEPGGYVTVEISGQARYPKKQTVTNVITGAPLDFVGRNVNFQISKTTDSLAAQKLLTLTAKHQFNLSGSESNYSLGDNEMSDLFTLQDKFENEITALMPDNALKTNWENNDKMKSEVDIIDTSRFVDGSVASTRPSIVISYPAQFITQWSRQGGANDIVKQSLTLLAVDDPAVATAPVEFTIVNNVPAYTLADAS
jgi:hypothetical protein